MTPTLIPTRKGGFTYRDVSDLKSDMVRYGATKGCKTPVRITKDNSRLCFMEIGYGNSLGKYHKIIECPKIEVCKTCRVLERPVLGHVKTIIDLDMLGLEPPKIVHLSLEEQLATKLFVVGSSGRQRNHFDAYDSFRILKYNKPDMKRTRDIFKTLCTKRKSMPSSYMPPSAGDILMRCMGMAKSGQAWRRPRLQKDSILMTW